MPTLGWRYLTALRYDRTSATGGALAEAWQTVSHDRLTRLLQADCSGPTRLALACRTRLVVERGALISADAVLPKPLASVIAGLAGVSSSQAPRSVSGLSLALLIWTEGTVRLPRGLRLWHQGGPAPSALALA